MKLPAHVLFRKDLSLMLWKPYGTLDEVIVNEIVAFIDVDGSPRPRARRARRWLNIPVEVLMAQYAS